MICIVDYGAGNLSSVAKAVRWLGYSPSITSAPREVAKASAVIFPGVGAAGNAMAALESKGLDEAMVRSIGRGVPFLGICLGLQLLLEASEESEGQPCLGIVPGKAARLSSGLKVPHMGWNQVHQNREHPIFKGIPDDSFFYFVHSYCASIPDAGAVVGETEYGVRFCSVLARDNVVATQFHPEKSGRHGLAMLANFLSLAGMAV